jgi:hypothetical protein
MSDRPVAKASTYTGEYNLHNRKTSMPRAKFKPATPATKLPQTYTLDRAATGIGPDMFYNLLNAEVLPCAAKVLEKSSS